MVRLSLPRRRFPEPQKPRYSPVSGPSLRAKWSIQMRQDNAETIHEIAERLRLLGCTEKQIDQHMASLRNVQKVKRHRLRALRSRYAANEML